MNELHASLREHKCSSGSKEKNAFRTCGTCRRARGVERDGITKTYFGPICSIAGVLVSERGCKPSLFSVFVFWLFEWGRAVGVVSICVVGLLGLNLSFVNFHSERGAPASCWSGFFRVCLWMPGVSLD